MGVPSHYNNYILGSILKTCLQYAGVVDFLFQQILLLLQNIAYFQFLI